MKVIDWRPEVQAARVEAFAKRPSEILEALRLFGVFFSGVFGFMWAILVIAMCIGFVSFVWHAFA